MLDIATHIPVIHTTGVVVRGHNLDLYLFLCHFLATRIQKRDKSLMHDKCIITELIQLQNVFITHINY